ncbi:hypothetical protein A9259_16775 [Vibrio cyclitrophicus]|uniref:hypothetical protein n=1 Tax=Vibrio cyclitrophicus TaxID=47951 RepID=UPI0007EE9D6A|nr:hypothetical protein [Vibrio cyclitrophicus]OBS93545.1 hypothetical protein A9259_16775 [Vibrio cyclitrophicus]
MYPLYSLYCNASLAFIVMLGYLIKGLDYLLLPILTIELIRLFYYVVHNKNSISKEFLFILFIGFVLVLGTVFNGNQQQAIKIFIYLVSAYLIVLNKVFNVKVFIFGMLASFIYYTVFIQGIVGMFGGLSFYVYARNYTVFVAVFTLFLFIKSPYIINAITFISLSRWNFLSLIGVKSIFSVLLLPVAAYVKIFFYDFDTGVGLKTSSDYIRMLLTRDVIDNLSYFSLGLPSSVIEHRLGLIFTADTYESILLERFSLFGIFSLPLIIHHFRLVILGLNSVGKSNKYALYYLFLFPIFNPLSFAFIYYLFYYYYSQRGKHEEKE